GGGPLAPARRRSPEGARLQVRFVRNAAPTAAAATIRQPARPEEPRPLAGSGGPVRGPGRPVPERPAIRRGQRPVPRPPRHRTLRGPRPPRRRKDAPPGSRAPDRPGKAIPGSRVLRL